MGFFSNIWLVKTNYLVNGTSVENGLMIHSKISHLARRNCTPESNAGIHGIYIVQVTIVSVFIGNSCM